MARVSVSRHVVDGLISFSSIILDTGERTECFNASSAKFDENADDDGGGTGDRNPVGLQFALGTWRSAITGGDGDGGDDDALWLVRTLRLIGGTLNVVPRRLERCASRIVWRTRSTVQPLLLSFMTHQCDLVVGLINCTGNI